MPKSHSVDILESGFVLKTANAAEFNEKLKTEVRQIQALHGIYPDLMVPVLHNGLVGDRHFYILERKTGSSLSQIIFDPVKPVEERRQIVQIALKNIKRAVEIECKQPIESAYLLHHRIQTEWKALQHIHDLFDRRVIVEGKEISLSGRAIVEKALTYAKEEHFLTSSTCAHCNFHFGNVLYDDSLDEISFIDPDGSVQGIDPYFGFARFAFSFWHELAAERQDSLNVIPLESNLLFILKEDEHRHILKNISEISNIHGISTWIDEDNFRKFYALVTYCFLRSMRINGSSAGWEMPNGPRETSVEEVLFAGLTSYLEGFSPTTH
jgi:hypothetical protein